MLITMSEHDINRFKVIQDVCDRRLRRCCQRQFKIDPLIDVIAEVKLTHPRN